MNSNSDSRGNNKYQENNVVKLEASSAEEKESKMYSEKYALNKEQLKV